MYAIIVYLSMYAVLHIVCGISHGACHVVELGGVARWWHEHACYGVFVLQLFCVYHYCVICVCLLLFNYASCHVCIHVNICAGRHTLFCFCVPAHIFTCIHT